MITINIDTHRRIIRINTRVNIRNDAAFESKHPRDKDGKFGRGNGSTGENIQVIVKPVSDIKSERKRVFKWYQDNLQGTTVKNPTLGIISFSRTGGTHSMHKSSEEKIALIPHLKEIISTGNADGWKPLKHNRKDNFTEWALVQNTVILNGKKTKVGCFIAKDSNGKIYYDLYINKAVDSYIPEYKVRANNGFNNINEESFVVNLFILS